MWGDVTLNERGAVGAAEAGSPPAISSDKLRDEG